MDSKYLVPSCTYSFQYKLFTTSWVARRCPDLYNSPTLSPMDRPHNFQPLHDLSRIVFDLPATFQLCFVKTVRIRRDRQRQTETDRDRQRRTILFIDINIRVCLSQKWIFYQVQEYTRPTCGGMNDELIHLFGHNMNYSAFIIDNNNYYFGVKYFWSYRDIFGRNGHLYAAKISDRELESPRERRCYCMERRSIDNHEIIQ